MLSSDSGVTGIVQIFGNSANESNLIHEEIKSRLSTGNACSYSVQNLISSSFLSKNIKIQWTIILPVVLYGCETWSVTLREKQAEDVWQWVLRRVFRSKKSKVTGEWKWLHDEELYDLYALRNNFRVIESGRMRWTGHVTRMGKRRVAHRVLVGRPEGKNHLQDWDIDGSSKNGVGHAQDMSAAG